MLVFRINVVAFCETQQLLRGLLVNFILNAGKVHGDIAAIGKAQGLDNVDEVKLRLIVGGNSLPALHHRQ